MTTRKVALGCVLTWLQGICMFMVNTTGVTAY